MRIKETICEFEVLVFSVKFWLRDNGKIIGRCRMPIKWNCVSNRRIGLNPSFRGNCRSQIKEYAFWFWFGRRCKRGFKAFLSYGRKLCFAGTLCAAYIEFKVGSLVFYLIVSVYNAHIELHWKIGWHWPRLRWPVRCTHFQFQLLLLIRPLAGPSLRWFSVSISIFSFPLTLAGEAHSSQFQFLPFSRGPVASRLPCFVF